MSTPDISVVISSRPGRPGTIVHNLDRAKALSSDMSNIEFVIKVDHDDQFTRETLDAYIPKSGLNIRYYIMDGLWSRAGINEYTNFLTWQSRGKLIWYWSDELQQYTQDWNIVAGRYAQYSEQPMVLMARTPTNPGGYCYAPLVTRKWVEVTGRFSYHPNIDSFVDGVSGELRQRRLGPNRIELWVMTDVIVFEMTPQEVERVAPLNKYNKIVTQECEQIWRAKYHQMFTDQDLELNSPWVAKLWEASKRELITKYDWFNNYWSVMP